MTEQTTGKKDMKNAARRWTIYVCPECGEQVEPPGHNVYSDSQTAGHYHEIPNADEPPYDRWCDAKQVVIPAPGAERRLYRVNVEGGGSFLYDLIDVGRFALRLAEVGDTRPISVKPEPLGSSTTPREDGEQS